MNKSSLLCSILSAILIPMGAFASDPSSTPPSDEGHCKPMLKIEKIAPPYVKNGDKIEFKIFVRNLSRCKVKDLTVKDFLPTEFRLKKKGSEEERSLSYDKDHKFTIIKWRNISIKPHDFIVIKFEAIAYVKDDDHYNKNRVRNIACVIGDFDHRNSYGDDSEAYSFYNDHDHDNGEVVGQALCSSVPIEIISRPYHHSPATEPAPAPAPAPLAILNQ